MRKLFPHRKPSIRVVLLFLLTFSVAWWGCPTEVNDPPPPPQGVNPPKNISLKISGNVGGNSFATVGWNHSNDQGREDFKGYRVITYELNVNNEPVSVFQEQAIQKGSTSHIIDSLQIGVRYRTVVAAESNANVRSDTISTPVYGGVIFNNNGEIEEFTEQGVSKSGYGWNIGLGTGFIYDYNAAVASLIDVHLRKSSNRTFFYSPNRFPPGIKITRISPIGQGQDAFDKISLPEPDTTATEASLNGVYLLKTQQNNYIKVWVRNIDTLTVNSVQFRKFMFDYKIQSITGLRVL